MTKRFSRRRVSWRLWFISIILSLLGGASYFDWIPAGRGESEWRGRVVRVLDGDTIEVQRGRRAIRIRLAQIDTPEKKQIGGIQAKHFLTRLVLNKMVLVVPVERDRYQRVIGHIYDSDQHINSILLGEGHAWVYSQYVNNGVLWRRPRTFPPYLYLQEIKARFFKKGLWRLPVSQQIPPWQWRQQYRRQ